MVGETLLSRSREQAVALRLAGKSRREIKQILGVGNSTLNAALRGVPPPLWTARPRAKDDQHARARELRAAGLTYTEIAAELGVSKGSVSLWVRDLPRTGRLSYEQYRQRQAEGVARFWAHERAHRDRLRQSVVAGAASEVGPLTDRELLIAGAIAYWCEGSKRKPHRRADRVVFINSDPGLVRLFLRFLTVAGIETDRISCRLHIHESADVLAAGRYWRELTGLTAEQFQRPTLKRHNPRTNRQNTGEQYRGCLRVEVRQGAALYRRIEGWAAGAMKELGT